VLDVLVRGEEGGELGHGLDTGVIGFESGVGLENASATLVQSVNGADILK